MNNIAKNQDPASDNAEVPLDPVADPITQCISQCMEELVWEMTRALFPRTIHQLRGSAPPLAKATNRHTPPTTTNARQHTPPPPPSRRHSHSLGVAHKRVTQASRPVHATTQETARRRAATPNATEGTGSTPHHVANGPKGPSSPLTRATAALRKRRHTTQCRRSGVKVCRLLPLGRGLRPPLADALRPGNAPRRAEARDAEVVERPGSDPPNATTTRHDDGDGDRTAPRAPPHTTVHLAQRPWRCAQARDGDRQTTPCRDPPTTTRHHHHTRHWDAPPAPPLTLSTGPKGSGVVCKRATSIVNHCCGTATTLCHHHHDHLQGTPRTHHTTTVDQRQPQRRAEARDIDSTGPRDDREDTTPPRRRRSGHTQRTPHVHHPPGCKAQASCTSARCRSRETANRRRRRRTARRRWRTARQQRRRRRCGETMRRAPRGARRLTSLYRLPGGGRDRYRAQKRTRLLATSPGSADAHSGDAGGIFAYFRQLTAEIRAWG
jgi:hypothetical protein